MELVRLTRASRHAVQEVVQQFPIVRSEDRAELLAALGGEFPQVEHLRYGPGLAEAEGVSTTLRGLSSGGALERRTEFISLRQLCGWTPGSWRSTSCGVMLKACSEAAALGAPTLAAVATSGSGCARLRAAKMATVCAADRDQRTRSRGKWRRRSERREMT